MIIDKTYFIRGINLPTDGYNNAIHSFIEQYEREYLRGIFGLDLAAQIEQYDPVASPQNIIDIVEGKSFVIDGENVRWNGLANQEKESPLAYYVYYHYVRDQFTHTAVVGEVKTKQENSTNANPRRKLVDAWNKYVELTCGEPGVGYVSLFTFLEKSGSYPKWQRPNINLDKINVFGV